MTRTLSADADLSPTLAVADGVESVRQLVIQRLRLHRGEWFLQADRGLPWAAESQSLLRNPALIQALIADEILQVSDVIGVSNVRLLYDRATRRLSLSLDIATRFGPMSIAEGIG